MYVICFIDRRCTQIGRRWMLSLAVPQGSRFKETLHFLLDHPRRCFVYLFPSHQTWFLFTVLLSLKWVTCIVLSHCIANATCSLTDWFCFLVLDLGNPEIMSIPPGVRVVIGTLQACAVRAAGFATVSLASLAPAVKYALEHPSIFRYPLT